MGRKIEYSFAQWCIDNDRRDILDRWDYDLNNKTPWEISYKSNKKYWFKCPRGVHDSQLQDVQYLPSGRSRDLYCTKCRSFAQYIIDEYGEEYLENIWNKDNILDPWAVSYKSMKKAKFNCLHNSDHVFEMFFESYSIGQRCPYCSHATAQGVYLPDSLGVLYPEILELWSDKNEKTPYDYYPGSGQKIWLKCREGKHDDYQQRIQLAVRGNFRCPDCVREIFTMPHYCDSFRVDPIRRKTQKMIRYTADSNKWRESVLKRDGYTCQCCGFKTDFRMNVHHIENFADNEELRCDVTNGITLCDDCHNVIKKGSFHNTYGTINNTPEQLETYINNKRQQLGIAESFSLEEYKAGKILKPN